MDFAYDNVSNFYQNVVDEVITKLKETFLEEDLGLEVLEKLQILWTSKILESKNIKGYDVKIKTENVSSITLMICSDMLSLQ